MAARSVGPGVVVLGRNGTGKTSVLHVLRNIQNLIVRGSKVDDHCFAIRHPPRSAAGFRLDQSDGIWRKLPRSQSWSYKL